MRSSLPFTRLSRVSGAAKVGAGNAWSRHRETTARSTALASSVSRDGWFEGRVAPGRTADVFCEQVRAAVARSRRRGRVAIVIADNLRAHTPAGSLLVRSMLSELKEHLYLVYTPAYDPDANRIEWLWRVSRRVVTHNHHRSDFALLLADVQTHFQALSQAPADVLCHIGSPFAPAKVAKVPQTHAA